MTPNHYFGLPVFRYGMICEILENINHEQAIDVAKSLDSRLSILKNHFCNDPSDFGFKNVKFINEKCNIEDQEGVVINYPCMSVSFDQIQAETGMSITVCRAPRHSKIWLRLSYTRGLEKYQESGAINADGLIYFYTLANKVCDRWSEKLLEEYQNALRVKKIGTIIEKKYKITMKTSTANLGVNAHELETNTFRMSNIFQEPAKSEPLLGLLYLTYGQDVHSLVEYRGMPDACKWIAMNVNAQEPMIGLFSEYQNKLSTNYTGLTHAVSISQKESSERARSFSRYLLKDIAPMI
jgi:hypothetical protein